MVKTGISTRQTMATMRSSSLCRNAAVALACVLATGAVGPAWGEPDLSSAANRSEQVLSPDGPEAGAKSPAARSAVAGIGTFLDRLMMAESGGRDDVANPRSTAVGAYQFIARTFLDLARRHFESETRTLSDVQILALRTNRSIARRAAEIYTYENAQALVDAGLAATWPNLRLAYLLGAGGAIRTLKAPSDTPLRDIHGAPVIAANPFMARLTAGDLAARAAREVGVSVASAGGIEVTPNLTAGAGGKRTRALQVGVRCSLSLPSCRRWLMLAERRVLRLAASPDAPRRDRGPGGRRIEAR